MAAARASGSSFRRRSARMPGTASRTIWPAFSSRCPSGQRRSWSSPRIGRRISQRSASIRSPECSTTITAFPSTPISSPIPRPGDPELGTQVKRLIEAAGLPVATDGERGFDHGVFVPFLILDPKAEIPVVMLSLRKDLDPAFHIRLGKALEPLRDQGVAIVGSGMSFHDLRTFRDGDTTASAAFDAWLDETAKAPAAGARGAACALGQGALGAPVPPARGASLAADGGRRRRRRKQGHARLQRQDRRQDDLGVSVRVKRAASKIT